jgi:hypothetical protein
VTKVDVTSLDAILRDMYPTPGERLKQWVVDSRREAKWEGETCPQFDVPEHYDNTGAPCRNGGERVPWTHLSHDCCSDCCDMHDNHSELPSVQSWLAEKAERPPVEPDRSKLSDQLEPRHDLTAHPWRRRT